MQRILLWLATGFGLGLSPVAPGTVASILGVGIALALGRLAWWWQVVAALALALAAIPICDVAEKHFAEKDDHRIVADEFLTFPICTIGLPCVQHPWLLGVAFVTNRAMDILKPWPARQVQSLKGGLGVALDDAISCLYALAINYLVWRASLKFR